MFSPTPQSELSSASNTGQADLQPMHPQNTNTQDAESNDNTSGSQSAKMESQPDKDPISSDPGVSAMPDADSAAPSPNPFDTPTGHETSLETPDALCSSSSVTGNNSGKMPCSTSVTQNPFEAPESEGKEVLQTIESNATGSANTWDKQLQQIDLEAPIPFYTALGQVFFRSVLATFTEMFALKRRSETAEAGKCNQKRPFFLNPIWALSAVSQDIDRTKGRHRKNVLRAIFIAMLPFVIITTLISLLLRIINLPLSLIVFPLKAIELAIFYKRKAKMEGAVIEIISKALEDSKNSIASQSIGPNETPNVFDPREVFMKLQSECLGALHKRPRQLISIVSGVQDVVLFTALAFAVGLAAALLIGLLQGHNGLAIWEIKSLLIYTPLFIILACVPLIFRIAAQSATITCKCYHSDYLIEAFSAKPVIINGKNIAPTIAVNIMNHCTKIAVEDISRSIPKMNWGGTSPHYSYEKLSETPLLLDLMINSPMILTTSLLHKLGHTICKLGDPSHDLSECIEKVPEEPGTNIANVDIVALQATQKAAI